MDQKNLLSHTFELIRKQRFHQRWRQVVTCLAAVVVFLTTYMLILPAITMEHGSMEVTATASEMFLGETNYTEILAKADDGRAETVFALTADGENAGLDGKRIKFSDGGTAKIPTRDGEKVELHREYQEDGQVVYWFALKRGEQANFRLPWVNGVGRYRAEAEVLETFPDGTYVGQEIPEAPDGPDWIPEEWDGSPWISEEESDPTATASELGGTTGRPRSRSGRRQLPIQNGRRDTSWGREEIRSWKVGSRCPGAAGGPGKQPGSGRQTRRMSWNSPGQVKIQQERYTNMRMSR